MATPLALGVTNDHHLRGAGHNLSGDWLLDLVIQVRDQLVHQAGSVLHDGLRHHRLRSSGEGVK